MTALLDDYDTDSDADLRAAADAARQAQEDTAEADAEMRAAAFSNERAESLRTANVARAHPAVTRAAREDTSLGGRYHVPRGQIFTLLLNALHVDPAVWPEPSRFDPDRFLPEAVKARPSWAYKPFGIGRRSCTGKHFALIEASLCVALVVRDFDLDDPGPLVLQPTVSPKPRGFLLSLRPRAAAR